MEEILSHWKSLEQLKTYLQLSSTFFSFGRGQMSIPPAESGPDGKIPPAPGTNQIAGFVEFRPLTHCEKNKNIVMHVFSIWTKRILFNPVTAETILKCKG